MKMRRTNTYNVNLTQTMNIPRMLKANLDAADNLLDFFLTKKKINKDSLLPALNHVILNYQEDHTEVLKQFPIDVDEKWKHLHELPDLTDLFKSVFLTNINFKSYADKIEDGKVELKMEDAVPGYYLCEFCVAKAVSEVIPSETAIEYIQEYTKLTHSRPNPRRKSFDKLSEFREWLEPLCKDSHEFISEIEEDESEYRFYVTKCWWAQALQKYGDTEIFTAMICDGDFTTTGLYNENFILTRNKTRMGENMGQDCCDFCYHDKRKKNEISHLSAEKWEEMKK